VGYFVRILPKHLVFNKKHYKFVNEENLAAPFVNSEPVQQAKIKV